MIRKKDLEKELLETKFNVFGRLIALYIYFKLKENK